MLVHNAKSDIHLQIATLIKNLKRRELAGGYAVGLSTANLMLRFVSASKWASKLELLNSVRALGKRLEYAQPQAFVCGNVVRRVLAIIRESYDSEGGVMNNGVTNNSSSSGNNEKSPSKPESLKSKTQAADAHSPPPPPPLASNDSSMFGLLSTKSIPSTSSPDSDSKKANKDYKADIIEGIQELIDEIQNTEETISSMSLDMIHENELILTPTPESNTVLKFLLRAARQKQNFTVIVTESYPNNTDHAHRFVKELNKAGIETVLVPDTMAFAIMSRIGKVVIGARAVLANGGCISSSGVGAVCECAKNYRTPVLVVTGIYKLSPLYPYDSETLVEIGDSGKVVEFNNAEMVDELEVVNPICDYIAAENVDIVITNLGGYSSSFVYRLVLDHYSPKDVNLEPLKE